MQSFNNYTIQQDIHILLSTILYALIIIIHTQSSGPKGNKFSYDHIYENLQYNLRQQIKV